MSPVLFNIFIKVLDYEVERILCEFVDNMKLGGVADSPVSHTAIENDLDRLER